MPVHLATASMSHSSAPPFVIGLALLCVSSMVLADDERPLIKFVFPKVDDEIVNHFVWRGTRKEWDDAGPFIKKHVRAKYDTDTFSVGEVGPDRCGYLYIKTEDDSKSYYLSSAHEDRASAEKDAQQRREMSRKYGWNYTVHDVVCSAESP